MTKAAWASLAVPPLGAVAGLAGLMLGMGGMIAGLFVLVLLPVPLLVAFPPVIRGLRGRYGKATWLRILFGLAALMSLSILGLVGAEIGPSLSANPPRFLPKTSDGKRAARLEFRFPKVTRVVNDPHGRIRFYHGEAPEWISAPDGSRTLVFRGDWAALSTWADRVSVEEDSFKIGGWMGATIADKEIRVTEAGSFDMPFK